VEEFFSMKKTLGFYSLLLLAFPVSVLLVTGCSNPSASVPGTPGTPEKPGPSVVTGIITPAALQTLVNRGAPILIGGAVQVQGGLGGIVDLKSAYITVDGSLSFSNCTVNAVNADITVGGGSITINDSVILVPAVEPAWVGKATGNGTLVPLTSVEEFIRGNGLSYTLQSVYIDSAGKISGMDISRDLGGKKIYVIGELKNDYASLDISRNHSNIIALGSINSSADIKLGAATLSGGLTTTGAATLTAVRTVTVGGNLSTGTGAVATDAPFTVKGTASIGGAFKLTNAVTFEGDVSFADDITRAGSGTLNFEGNVTIAKGKKINLPGIVTLAKDKSINGVLTAGTPVTLTPAVNTVLTVDAANSRKFTIDTAGCTLGRGRLIVSSGATVVFGENFTVAAGATLVNNGTIPITAAKALILSASSTDTGRIAGTGTVIAGKTIITGPWEVDGTTGTVTITNTSDNGATITVYSTNGLKAGGPGAVITQTAGAGNVLTIGVSTAIALGGDGTTAAGSVVLKGAAADPGKLVFAANGYNAVGSSLVTTDITSSIAINNVTKIAGNTGVGKGIAGIFDNAVIGGATRFKRLGAGAFVNSITGGSADTILSGGAYTTGSFGN
jgi:hypothetical protein